MKKVALLAVVAFAMTFTSCKKSYTCTCTIAGQTTTATYEKVSKDEAEAAETACSNGNTAAQIFGGSCTWAKK